MPAPSAIERRSRSAFLFNGLLVLLTAAYPFIVYLTLGRWNIRYIALLVLVSFGLRLLVLRGKGWRALRGFLPLLLAITVICGLVLWRGDHRFLLYYPVIVSAIMLLTFAHTLWRPPAMIERFARLSRSELPPAAIPYCRKVTLIWCVFFVLNGSASLLTALLGDMRLWTLYNGLLSYLFMGLLFIGEFLVRRVVQRRHQADQASEQPAQEQAGGPL